MARVNRGKPAIAVLLVAVVTLSGYYYHIIGAVLEVGYYGPVQVVYRERSPRRASQDHTSLRGKGVMHFLDTGDAVTLDT